MERVSAIIVTLDRFETVRRVIEALARQTVTPDEIIVVDQSAEDYAAQMPPGVTDYIHTTPCGPAKARNIGARRSAGEILLFVEDDAEIVSRDFVEKHLRWYEYPFVDVVHGAVQQVGQELPPTPDWTPGMNAVEWLRLSPNCRRRQICIGLAGGNFSVRRGLFFAVGGFDERFYRTEDKDLGIRLYQAGAVMIYDPEPLLIHLRLPASGTRSERSPAFFGGLLRPEPHPGEYLLYLKHWPGWQARCWILERLAKIWAWRNWLRPDRCLLKTIRLWRCVAEAGRLARG